MNVEYGHTEDYPLKIQYNNIKLLKQARNIKKKQPFLLKTVYECCK